MTLRCLSCKSNRLMLIVTAGLLAGGCELITPPSEDPVLIKLNELEQRLATIERVVQNQSLVGMSQQVSSLERRTDELQGMTESLGHNANTTAERQRRLYVDLDARIQQLEARIQTLSARDVMDGGNLTPGQLPVPGGSDGANYRAAFELIKAQRFDDAEIAFEQFLASFPDSENAPNAQYWLAESYYVRSRFDDALKSFQTVIDQYPGSSKVPDALLKTGYCSYELKRWNDARTALAQVQADFPDTTAARLAGQRLSRMDSEGV